MSDPDAKTAWLLFQLNWYPILAMGALLALGLATTGFSVEPVAFGATTALGLALVGLCYHHRLTRRLRADPKLVLSIGTIGQVILVCAIVGPLSYLASAANLPLRDHMLLAIDRGLGLDPLAIAQFVNAHPRLGEALAHAYGLIKWPLLLIPIVLTLTARHVRLQRFMLALSLALAITLMIAVLVPAIGTYHGLGLSAAHLPDIDTSVYAGQLQDILALRDGSLRELRLLSLSGVVSFPSFHAASGVLYAWALWPVRGIGPLAALLNAMMIAATPVIGAHYMVDVIGAMSLAALSIWVSGWIPALVTRNPRPPRHRASLATAAG